MSHAMDHMKTLKEILIVRSARNVLIKPEGVVKLTLLYLHKTTKKGETSIY